MRTAARQAATAVARVEAKVVATQAVKPAAIAATTVAMLLMMVDTAKVNMLAVMAVAQRSARPSQFISRGELFGDSWAGGGGGDGMAEPGVEAAVEAARVGTVMMRRPWWRQEAGTM